jgi:cytochrome c1
VLRPRQQSEEIFHALRSSARAFRCCTSCRIGTVVAAGTDARPVKDVASPLKGRSARTTALPCSVGFRSTRKSCSACHSLNRESFHALADEGGPGFTEAQAKAIAASYKIPAEPNDQGQTWDENGERLTRPGILADHFPPPFPNENAARAANGGALPPDLSLVAKSFHHGPQFIYRS